jgi:hypothetical protein
MIAKQESKLTPGAAEAEPVIAELKRLGEDIVSFTAGKNDAVLPNSTSAFVPYGDGARLTVMYKEEGAAKIGPELVIQDQRSITGGSLKTFAFRWPESYPSDKNTWGLTLIDSSLPQQERRRDITGSALREEDIQKIEDLVAKARLLIPRGADSDG